MGFFMLPSWFFFVETKFFSAKMKIFLQKRFFWCKNEVFPQKQSLFGWFRANRVCYCLIPHVLFFFNERSLFGRFWTHRGFLVDSRTNRTDFRTNRVNSSTNSVDSAEKESFWFIFLLFGWFHNFWYFFQCYFQQKSIVC